MLFVLRWLLPALLPAALLVALGAHVARRPGHREPPSRMIATFVLGALAAAAALYLVDRAAGLTGLDVRVSAAGQTGALVFVFFVVVPLQEAGEVASVWPAMMLKRFDQPFDGVVYAACSALGFAAVQNAVVISTAKGALFLSRDGGKTWAHMDGPNAEGTFSALRSRQTGNQLIAASSTEGLFVLEMDSASSAAANSIAASAGAKQ